MPKKQAYLLYRELPLPKAIAQARVAGFFAEQPDTVWALHGVALERDGLNASFSLRPVRAPKPPALPSVRWVYRIPSRRLERMSAAQYRALQENRNYLRWQLGGEGIGALGGSGIYARTLRRLRDQLLAPRIVSPQIERMSATVLQVGQQAVLLEVGAMYAPTLLSKTPRLQYHYYLVERARPDQPRRIGATIARHEAALMEDSGRVWGVVADRSSGRTSILNGQGGYFRQTGAADALLRLRGVEAHWQRSESERQIRAWLQEQGIEIQAFGTCQLEGLSF